MMQDPKRLAACSTISRISYSVLGLGAMTVVSIEGGMFFFLGLYPKVLMDLLHSVIGA